MDFTIHFRLRMIFDLPESPSVYLSQSSFYSFTTFSTDINQQVMSFSDEITSSPSTSLLTGRARGRVRSRGGGRGQPQSATRRRLFAPIAKSSIPRVVQSTAPASELADEVEPSSVQPVNESFSAPSNNSGGRSETLVTPTAFTQDNSSVERISALLLERDQLASSLSTANQSLSELEHQLHEVQVVKTTLIQRVDDQEAEIKTLKAEKESVMKMFFMRQEGIEPDRKRMKGGDMYAGLELRYYGVVSQLLKILSASCSRETAELSPFDADLKRRWIRRGENVSHNGVVVSSGLVIAPFPSDSLARSGRFYQPSFSSDKDFLKSLVLHEIKVSSWSEFFSSAEEPAACVEAIESRKTLCSRLRHCLSDELSNRKRKAKDLLFTSLGYRCLQSRFLPRSEIDKETRMHHVEEAIEKLLSRADNVDLNFGYWRTANVSKLKATESASDISFFNQDASENLQLFQHDIAVQVLHEFIGFSVPSLPRSENRVKGVEGTIISLARLDAYIARLSPVSELMDQRK